MKKILTLIMVLALSSSASYAISFGQALRNAIRQDVKATKQEVKKDIKDTKKDIKDMNKSIKNQIKTDIENSKKAHAEAEAARKKEALKQINAKLSDLNKEMKTVKNDKNITETERVIRTRALQRQIDYYNKQKAILQKK